LILLNFPNPLALLLANFDPGDTHAALDPRGYILLAIGHKLTLTRDVSGEALFSNRHRHRNGTLSTTQFRILGVLCIRLTPKTLGQIGTRFGQFVDFD
jgi:hypothetical protein